MAGGPPPRRKVLMKTVPDRNLDSSEDELSGSAGAAPSFVSTGWASINQPPPNSVASSSHITIVPPILEDSNDYKLVPGENVVRKVLRQKGQERGELVYKTIFEDGHVEKISEDVLRTLENGTKALKNLHVGYNSSEASSEDEMVTTRKARTRTRRDMHMKSWNTINLEGENSDGNPPPRRSGRKPELLLDDSRSSSVTLPSLANSSEEGEPSESEEDDYDQPRRSSRVVNKHMRQKRVQISHARSRGNAGSSGMRISRSRRGRQEFSDEEEEESSDDGDGFRILQSDVNPRKRKRGHHFTARRSSRHRNSVNMAEVGEDNIYRTDSSRENPRAPKIIAVREVFKPLARDNLFRARHMNVCDICRNNVGDLVHCQGCSLSYHKNCLGHRSGREHVITKIGEEDFVLQCRRCVNIYRRKDPTAPDMARCQDCKQTGESCTAFKDRKSPAQEQKEREDNDGVDPITYVVQSRINNAANLLFRCVSCWRAWHFHHLPPRGQWDIEYNDSEDRAESRFFEYSSNWRCLDCHELENKKISNIVAWRPADVDAYQPDVPVEFVDEDEKEYLVKWEGFSYFQVQWMSGAWVWGCANPASRKSFFKKGPRPEMTTEGAVPEEYLRIDIVLDVKYTNHIDIRTDEIDRARIREVGQALIKYKGLGYEDAVWEKVPEPEDGDRWTDFFSAYNDWVLGRYTHIPRAAQLRARIEKVRNQNFKELEKTSQPENLTGGELMKYQLEGLNWMYYQWHSQRNGILADEMGLGKTIQVIAFLATMAQDHNCFPFLVVVPNSTCPNWRREIKQWAPSLRVVAYYGSAMARQMASDYELFPNKSKDLHCHVVVTSYEAITDDSSRRFFKSVPWQGLIVDEGQRLKNDRSILHNTLASFKIPFRMLLTGTPLQNNARELFNLLQFLENAINAEQMEQEYASMTNENITKLHDLIRPYILRRTKAQVLTFLPPMAQIILPVSMSTLQKKLYKSIMAKNPELLRALFNQKTLKTGERANMNNILMQLRKCLCHPFVYSQAIEERNLQASALHRNLVEASSKLQLLELLLPKLKERGHRVLIFSQFLDMLNIVEDFLDGLVLPYQRLDGTVNSLTKQKRIDEFNAPNSPLFAFLLSTRAGGVGINLATADTVIILDPDFNPHQDIQALSRAHRIGQTKKVLCFQLMTRASAEEKIVQIGRKKMALDHVVVDQMDAEDMEDRDVESILKHGAAELFNDDGQGNNIRYDDASIEKLLDRSQIENTKAGADDSAESQFSFARVWANDQEKLEDTLESSEEEAPPDPGLWDKILKERERVAAAEAAAKTETFGRGRRARVAVNYDGGGKVISRDDDDAMSDVEAPQATSTDVYSAAEKTAAVAAQRAKRKQNIDSDTDFRADSSEESEAEAAHPYPDHEDFDLSDRRTSPIVASTIAAQSNFDRPAAAKPPSLVPPPFRPPPDALRPPPFRPNVLPAAAWDYGIAFKQPHPRQPKVHFTDYTTMNVNDDEAPVRRSPAINRRKPEALWKRVTVNYSAFQPSENEPFLTINNEKVPASWDSNQGTLIPKWPMCVACNHSHPTGSCPLKIAGVELCPLCGVAHYGIARQCPHIKSETMVRLMLEQLRNSPEDRQIVEAASKYLKGVKGHLVQNKKKAREHAEAKTKGTHDPMQPVGQASYGGHGLGQPTQYGIPAQITTATNGLSMYGQLEAVRNAPKYPPYPKFSAMAAAGSNGAMPPESEKDVEQRLLEAFGA